MILQKMSVVKESGSGKSFAMEESRHQGAQPSLPLSHIAFHKLHT
jgi:hypothetical protein